YLVNNGKAPADRLKVTVKLLDKQGEVVAREAAGELRSELPPGQKSPFATRIARPPKAWGDQDFEVEFKEVDPDSYWDLVRAEGVEVLSSEPQPAQQKYDWAKTTGELKNGGLEPIRHIFVVALVYDEEGRPAWAGTVSPKAEKLEPGASSSFSMTVSG